MDPYQGARDLISQQPHHRKTNFPGLPLPLERRLKFFTEIRRASAFAFLFLSLDAQAGLSRRKTSPNIAITTCLTPSNPFISIYFGLEHYCL